MGVATQAMGVAMHAMGVAMHVMDVAMHAMGVTTYAMGVAMQAVGVAMHVMGVATQAHLYVLVIVWRKDSTLWFYLKLLLCLLPPSILPSLGHPQSIGHGDLRRVG